MGNTVIFGGTFNPIHLGHVEIINTVAARPSTERVLVIPTAAPPHKVCSDLACDADRLEMCRIAAGGIQKVSVSDIELLRGGKSYTVETLRKIGRENPTDNLSLVCGGDMIVTFTTWYKYEEILKMAEIIAIRRVGVDNTEFDNAVKELINMGARITVLKSEIIGISSTEIREHLHDREFLLKYLPQGVYEYIAINNLYGGD